MAGQTLPDLLIALQHQELPPIARQVVEEAAFLLGEGREMEAAALVEKAQALANVAAKTNGAHRDDGSAEHFAARLAADITGVLTRAIQELQHRSAEHAQALTLALERRIAALENDLRKVAVDAARADEMAQSVAIQVEAVLSRLVAHEDRLEALDRVTADLTATFAEANQRLDRHTEILRGIQQRQVHRAAVLNELVGTIAKLKEQGAETEAAAQA